MAADAGAVAEGVAGDVVGVGSRVGAGVAAIVGVGVAVDPAELGVGVAPPQAVTATALTARRSRFLIARPGPGSS
jgi:hypothetical protein